MTYYISPPADPDSDPGKDIDQEYVTGVGRAELQIQISKNGPEPLENPNPDTTFEKQIRILGLKFVCRSNNFYT